MKPSPPTKVYTIQVKNKTISLYHLGAHYVVGFKNVNMVRKVHYSLNPQPNLLIVRDTNIDLHDELEVNGYDIPLKLDVNATLFIPKLKGCFMDPMNDTGFHISEYEENEFLKFPITKNIGIVLPYNLVEETDEEMMFKAYVIDPLKR
jgi:hypothetical protein